MQKKGLTFVEWFRAVVEVIALIVLFFHLIPEAWLEEEKKGGVLAIWFLGSITLLTILTNYIIYYEYRRDLSKRENVFNEQLNAAIINKVSQERKAKYADVFPILNKGFKELHNTLRKETSASNDYAFKEFCQMLSMAFKQVTDKECHVCIKVSILPKEVLEHPEANKDELKKVKVKTYVRSSSVKEREKTDVKTIEKKVEHLISQNTDFEEICFNGGEVFFCNNLCEITDYKNTSLISLGVNKTGVTNHEDVSVETREKKWKLDYKSVIVAPIMPSIQESEQDKAIVGFLCVDCEEKEVFLKEIDSHIIQGCADGIYNPFMKKFTSIIK